jgi:hypothetical protein
MKSYPLVDEPVRLGGRVTMPRAGVPSGSSGPRRYSPGIFLASPHERGDSSLHKFKHLEAERCPVPFFIDESRLIRNDTWERIHMSFPEGARYFLGGLAAFVLLLLLRRSLPIELPASLNLLLLVSGVCLMGFLYYRRTRDLWAPLFFLSGWLISDIPPDAWMVFARENQSVGAIIMLGAQAAGIGLQLVGLVLAAYRLFRPNVPRQSKP